MFIQSSKPAVAGAHLREACTYMSVNDHMRPRSTRAGKRSRSGAESAVRNDILRALLNSEYKHIRPMLERVNLEHGAILHRADQPIEHVYFPETAVVALVDTMENGATAEV